MTIQKIMIQQLFYKFNMEQLQQNHGITSFGESKRSNWYYLQNQTSLGPGFYKDNKLPKQIKPAWSMGKQKKIPKFLPKQQPSNQKINQSFDKKDAKIQFQPRSTMYSIPTAKRQYKINQLTSSLNYEPDIKNVKYSNPSFTFGYAKRTAYETETPPPNYYNNSKLTAKQNFNRTQVFFTTTQRTNLIQQKEKYPGVGQYHIQNQNSNPKIKFPTSKRPSYNAGSNNVGYYQIGTNMKNFPKGVSMGLKINQKIKERTPAPNQYTPKLIQSDKKIVTLTSKRSDIVNQQLKMHPNPGHYNLLRQELTKGIIIPTKKRPQVQIHQGPGPGYYNIEVINNTKVGKFRKSNYKPKEFITPSPQDYHTNKSFVETRSPNCINLDSKRTDFSKSITQKVGPGQYNIERKVSNELGTIAKSAKKKEKINQNPGPGAYQPNYQTIGKLHTYTRSMKTKFSQNRQISQRQYDYIKKNKKTDSSFQNKSLDLIN